jgi:hypothetical protein
MELQDRLKAARALLLPGLLLALVAGCDGAAKPVPAPESAIATAAAPTKAAADAAKKMPPSFLDQAPSGPVSDTMILSGGTLLGDPDLFDAVVVLKNGTVIAAGKRGDVPVPPDSIGIDASGRFIAPTTAGESLVGNDNLTLYADHPGQVPEAAVHAAVVDGEYQLR